MLVLGAQSEKMAFVGAEYPGRISGQLFARDGGDLLRENEIAPCSEIP